MLSHKRSDYGPRLSGGGRFGIGEMLDEVGHDGGWFHEKSRPGRVGFVVTT